MKNVICFKKHKIIKISKEKKKKKKRENLQNNLDFKRKTHEGGYLVHTQMRQSVIRY